MKPQRAPFSKIERWCLGATCCCGVLLLAAPLWWKSHKSTPLAVVPVPTLPNPNAFDIYVSAAGTVVQPNALLFAVRSPNSTAQSPLTTRTRRAAPVPTPLGGPPPGVAPSNAPPPVTVVPRVQRNYSLADKAALLQQNATALGTTRQGLQYECWNPPTRSFGVGFPVMRGFLDLTRLLALEAQVRRGRGDWNGAMNSSLDGTKFGSDIQRGGNMMSALYGLSCEGTARSQAWPSIQHLSARQARAAVKRLQSIMAGHTTSADAVQEEKWMGQASLMQLFAMPDSKRQIAGAMGLAPGWRSSLQFMFLNKKQVFDNYSKFMDVAIANAKLPYRAPRQPLPNLDDPVSRAFLPGFYNTDWTFASNETQNGLLLLALALRAYRLEQGAYPTSLSQLAPRYLKAVPRDPLARDLAFRYKVLGTKYLLYSVGPDGKDDNAEPISKQQRGRLRQQVQEHSRGDIVAGVDTGHSGLFF